MSSNWWAWECHPVMRESLRISIARRIAFNRKNDVRNGKLTEIRLKYFLDLGSLNSIFGMLHFDFRGYAYACATIWFEFVQLWPRVRNYIAAHCVRAGFSEHNESNQNIQQLCWPRREKKEKQFRHRPYGVHETTINLGSSSEIFFSPKKTHH